MLLVELFIGPAHSSVKQIKFIHSFTHKRKQKNTQNERHRASVFHSIIVKSRLNKCTSVSIFTHPACFYCDVRQNLKFWNINLSSVLKSMIKFSYCALVYQSFIDTKDLCFKINYQFSLYCSLWLLVNKEYKIHI